MHRLSRSLLLAALVAAAVGCNSGSTVPFNKQMVLVGFDSSDEMVAAVKTDRIHALVIQNPVNMGYLGVKRAVEVCRQPGTKLERKEDTGITVVTNANIDDPAIKPMLRLDESLLQLAATPAPAGKKPLRIAVIPKGETHEFWKSIHAGALKAAAELGGVEIVWKGPAREDDRSEQIKVVDNFVSGGVDAIVLAPLHEEALVGPVAAAKAKGIPVIVIDSGLKGDDWLSYVGTDNYAGGAAAARAMGAKLNGRGKVVMLRYSPGHESTGQREAGFKDTLAKEFPNITLANDSLYAGATRTEAKTKASNLLDLAPDADGVFCPNESSTYGMLLALDERR